MTHETRKLEENSPLEQTIDQAIELYATRFAQNHIAAKSNPNGIINMKIHNTFVAALGKETQFYSALVRSLDSSLGNLIEKIALDIAAQHYEVHNKVEGHLSIEQTRLIAELLESYKSRTDAPSVQAYEALRDKPPEHTSFKKRHDSDYYLIDRETQHHYLIELKIGGDLDNKKARSEKEALLEQYAILSNTLPSASQITAYFATAYNRFGENEPWNQGRVLQYFSRDELLIGREFWNFITKDTLGYQKVLNAYNDGARHIKEALTRIREAYLD